MDKFVELSVRVPAAFVEQTLGNAHCRCIDKGIEPNLDIQSEPIAEPDWVAKCSPEAQADILYTALNAKVPDSVLSVDPPKSDSPCFYLELSEPNPFLPKTWGGMEVYFPAQPEREAVGNDSDPDPEDFPEVRASDMTEHDLSRRNQALELDHMLTMLNPRDMMIDVGYDGKNEVFDVRADRKPFRIPSSWCGLDVCLKVNPDLMPF